MDELEKRRRQLADPERYLNSLTPEERESLSDDELNSVRQQKDFEKQLSQAFEIDVPNDLADKVLLNHRTRQSRTRAPKWAMAASVALAISVGLFLPTSSNLSLTAQALEHVEDESKYLTIDNEVSSSALQKRLTEMGFALTALPKEVILATRCGLAGMDAMHIIAKIKDQPVSLLITRQQNELTVDTFGDGNRVGKIVKRSGANLIVIADNMSLVEQFVAQIDGV